jgi:hypothetical protein
MARALHRPNPDLTRGAVRKIPTWQLRVALSGEQRAGREDDWKEPGTYAVALARRWTNLESMMGARADEGSWLDPARLALRLSSRRLSLALSLPLQRSSPAKLPSSCNAMERNHTSLSLSRRGSSQSSMPPQCYRPTPHAQQRRQHQKHSQVLGSGRVPCRLAAALASSNGCRCK